MINNSHENDERSFATDSSELSWLAFCYVADELDAKLRREFEIRLEHDQTAREAVAQAFDNAWTLDQAIAAQGSTQAATCELLKPEAKWPGRANARKTKNFWSTAVLGLCVTGLLVMVLPKLYNKPAEVAFRLTPPPQNEPSLAETWADADWEIDVASEIADVETNATKSDAGDDAQDFELDDGQDDWMTATLIDMAEESASLPLHSGS